MNWINNLSKTPEILCHKKGWMDVHAYTTNYVFKFEGTQYFLTIPNLNPMKNSPDFSVEKHI